MAETKGFAIRSFEIIDVATVSPTRRGAIVNWLVSSARRQIYRWTADEEIERHWRECSSRDHECIEVVIARAQPEKR